MANRTTKALIAVVEEERRNRVHARVRTVQDLAKANHGWGFANEREGGCEMM